MHRKTRRVAERVLSDAWGASVTLARVEEIRQSTKSHIFRYAVQSGSANSPSSVIVKRTGRWESESDTLEVPQRKLWPRYNEWAGLQFLTVPGEGRRGWAGSRAGSKAVTCMHRFKATGALLTLLLGRKLDRAI